jgi:nucleoside-diphosphate-sugar epimerase
MEFEHPALQIIAATRRPENLPADYHGEVRVGDLRDAEYLDRVLAGIDIICHAAGWTNYSSNEAASRKNYLEPTIELINRAIEWRISRFVNLSNIAVIDYRQRMHDDTPGKPRRRCAMFNCMIAVEDYLQARVKEQANNPMSIINLRTGIYCGQGLGLGLLHLLLRRRALPLLSGNYGFLPLVDGRDIGQAFARAALHPDMQAYLSLNITGPDTPQQKTVMQVIQAKIHPLKSGRIALPAAFALPVHQLINLAQRNQKKPLSTCAITAALTNPFMDSAKARELLGYQPQVGWQSSVEDFIVEFKKFQNADELFAAERQITV